MMMLSTEINIDEIIDMLAYIHAKQPLADDTLADGIEILMEGHGKWNLYELKRQVIERSEVIASAL
jgi:hypothetical protein